MHFQNSITEQSLAQVKRTWATELRDSETWLEQETQERILAFLNTRENICTAEFILRRQIQTQFPELLAQAASVLKTDAKDYADLSKGGNVAWPEKLTDVLSDILASTKFESVGDCGPDKRQWRNILRGEAFCNRNSAIKLIFALKMDEALATKFLIADGKNPFSTRNPFDYLCEFCLRGHFSYNTAVKLLNEFEAAREHSLDEDNAEDMEFATTRLENETEKILNNDKLRPEDKSSRVLEYMLKHQREFVSKVERKDGRAEYSSGFSKQNERNLKVFLSYLKEMYPYFLQWKELNEFDSILLSQEVKTKADGSPQNPKHLLQAIEDTLEIYLPETEELEEMGLPTGNERDSQGKRQLKEKQRYDAIPFNNEILLPLKNLSQALRSNLRGSEHPDNARDVDRSTVLFLAYFFICGCQVLDVHLKTLAEKLDAAIAREDNPQKNNLLYALKAVVNNVESLACEENPVELYVDSLNELLECFNCSKFYAPFVIDKFILLCLLTLRRPEKEEDFAPCLINRLIEKSYSWSKKILEGTRDVRRQ